MDFLSTDTKAGRLRKTLFELWQEHQAQGALPTSGRFLFYELVGRGVLVKKQKDEKGRRSDQDMIDALTDLRDAGLIPWEDIVDETRDLTQWASYPTIADGIREVWETARLGIWLPGSPPMILCESRSLKGVLESLAFDYQVPIASTNGQARGFLHTEVGPALKTLNPPRVLYLGDFDFSGAHIEANTKTVLETIVGEVAWERVAITEAQVKQYNLEPMQKWDKRTKSFHNAVETEALGQTRIVELLRTKLRPLMPDERRKDVRVRQERQRKAVGRKLGLKGAGQ